MTTFVVDRPLNASGWIGERLASNAREFDGAIPDDVAVLLAETGVCSISQTAAYNCWKVLFDQALKSAPTAIGTQLLRNSLPIYAVAHCTLAIDVDELQIFAGKRRALGLPVVSASDGRSTLAWPVAL